MTFGGRLTLLSGSPIIDRDVTSSTLWYAPHTGNQANGITFTSSSTDAVGLSLSLAGLPGNSIHKVFIGTGGIYLGSPSGSGTPYGFGLYGDGIYPGHDPDPPLSRLNGVAVNSAGDAHIGTILIDPAGGACTAHVTQGGKRRWGVWNRYNQRPIYIKAGVDVPGIYYPTAIIYDWGPLHNNSDNCLTFITGEPQPVEMGLFVARGFLVGNYPGYPTNAQYQCTIGLNRTDAADGLLSSSTFETTFPSGAVLLDSTTTIAPFISAPLLGANTAYALENQRSNPIVYGGNKQTMLWARMMA